jgi:hypothetical protein
LNQGHKADAKQQIRAYQEGIRAVRLTVCWPLYQGEQTQVDDEN